MSALSSNTAQGYCRFKSLARGGYNQPAALFALLFAPALRVEGHSLVQVAVVTSRRGGQMFEFLGFASVVLLVLVFGRVIMGRLVDKDVGRPKGPYQ